MPPESIRWSPHVWDLDEFPETLQIKLRKLDLNQPTLIDQVNGDQVYVRRVTTKEFRYGLSTATSHLPSAHEFPERARQF